MWKEIWIRYVAAMTTREGGQCITVLDWLTLKLSVLERVHAGKEKEVETG